MDLKPGLVRIYCLAWLLVIGSGCSSSVTHRALPDARSEPLTSLPDNPCQLLSAAEVAHVTAVAVTAAFRVPSITKVVRAQEEHRAPIPGTICAYQSRGAYGDIHIAVPSRGERSAARYWDARQKYFDAYTGSAESIAGLGQDAWISGGTSLRVLLKDGEYFSVSTQLYQTRSKDITVRVARAVLERFSAQQTLGPLER